MAGFGQQNPAAGGTAVAMRTNCTVLLIDEEMAGLMLRKSVLERAGFKTLFAPGGDEAMNLFRAHEIDAVVADRFTGSAALAGFMAMRRLKPHVPILCLSNAAFAEALAYTDQFYFMEAGEGTDILPGLLDQILTQTARKFPLVRDVGPSSSAGSLTQALLAAIVEDSTDAIFSKTLDGVITSWNHSAEVMYGYSREEVIGKSVAMLLPADRPDEVEHILRCLKRGERIVHFETVRVSKDGRKIDVALTISPIRDGQGVVVGASTVARDISSQKSEEGALRQVRERLNGIIESAMDGIITVDEDQRVVVFNKAAQELFRCPASEAMGRSLDEFIPRRFRDAHREHVRMFDSTGVTNRSMESPGVLAGVRKDGEEFPIEATISQVLAGDKKLFTVILRDISERRRAEEKLRRTEKLAAAGRMAHAVAHEINNPLAAVTNLLYLLRTEPMGETARGYISTAERELGRVTHIVRQTLQFYRDREAAVRFDVCGLVDEVLDLFSREITAEHVQVEREYHSQVEVIGHPSELRQVFINLISNSMEAGATLLRIRVTHVRNRDEARGDGVRMTLVDNGRGLSMESRNRAFEPFFTTKQEKGSGLGLWVTKGIIQKYEGIISMRSQSGSGHSGTCVRIFLPSSVAMPVASQWKIA